MSYTSRYLILCLTLILPLASVTPVMSQCDEKKEQKEAKETEDTKICPIYKMMYMGNLVGYYAVKPECGQPQLWWGPDNLTSNCATGVGCITTVTDKDLRLLTSGPPTKIEKGVTLHDLNRALSFEVNGAKKIAKVYRVTGKPNDIPPHPEKMMGKDWKPLDGTTSKFGYEFDSGIDTVPAKLKSDRVTYWVVEVEKMPGTPGNMVGEYQIFKK